MSWVDADIVRTWSHAGLHCMIRDSKIGFFNGYVQLPADHFGRAARYDQFNRTIRIHGRLTYGTDEDGWLGFDTGHAGDYWPGSERLLVGPAERTWDMERLAAEVDSLAEQVAAMTEFAEPESSWDCTEDEFDALLHDARLWRELAAKDGAR